MKLKLTEKQVQEVEDTLNPFAGLGKDKKVLSYEQQKALRKQVDELDSKMFKLAEAMQEEVPVEVAAAFFTMLPKSDYGTVSADDMKKNFQILDMAEKKGKIRIADVFILAKYQDNIRDK